MKRNIGIVFAGALVITGLSAAPAFAGANNSAPGNCVGKTTSYTAQGNDISPFVSAVGIGNVAKANDATTQAAMDYIKNIAC
jgi:hypothetical protein